MQVRDHEVANQRNDVHDRYSFSDDQSNFRTDMIEAKANEGNNAQELNLRYRIEKEFERRQKSGLLYNFIDNCVQNALLDTRTHIWRNIHHEMNTDRDSWSDLISMRNYESYDSKELSQD